MGRLFRTTIDCDRAALPGNRPQRSQDAAGADQEAGSGAEDRQTQNGTHHPKFVRLLSRVGGIWCPEPEVRCMCLASTGAWYFTAFGTQYTVRFRRSPSVRWPASAGLFIYYEPFPDRSRKKLYIDNELREFRRRSPGQYVSLRIGGVARSYSLTGAAVPTPDAYRIGVRHIEGGQGSTAVRYVLAPGDIVE